MCKIYCNCDAYSFTYGIQLLGNGTARLFKHPVGVTNDPEYTCTIPLSMLEKSIGFIPVPGMPIPKEHHAALEAAYKEYNPLDIPSYN